MRWEDIEAQPKKKNNNRNGEAYRFILMPIPSFLSF
jgi:hypothetical protein